MQGKNDPRITLRVTAWRRMMSARGCTTATAQAEELGVHASTIGRLCAGEVQPSSVFVARSLLFLGARFEELFDVEEAAA
ncbi:hypothetical protein [Nocardiopsis synnemataformans]|uniref:hypothetical protein n=1 Tax=Nocardiopsis synnemataformans TaxID=61305 RepID=UPI003EB88F73